MSKKVVRKMILAAVIVVTLFSSSTALAAPKTMADGTVFDAEFYAATYPDVVNVLGNSEAALYKHYVTNGKAEGRLAVAPGTATVTPVTTTAVVANPVYPDVVNKLAVAFATNDFNTVNTISGNFAKYLKQLEPYITATSTTGTRYNFNTPYGEFMIIYYKCDKKSEFNFIVKMGLSIMGHEVGDAIVAAEQQRQIKQYNSYGLDGCIQGVYGTDTFVSGDKLTAFYSTKKGKTVMNVTTDGYTYETLDIYLRRDFLAQYYADMGDVYRSKDASYHHFCIGHTMLSGATGE